MIRRLDKDEVCRIEGVIAAGLEYGDNNYDGEMDNKRIEEEFPNLLKVLEPSRRKPLAEK